jgi:hypothetical protein
MGLWWMCRKNVDIGVQVLKAAEESGDGGPKSELDDLANGHTDFGRMAARKKQLGNLVRLAEQQMDNGFFTIVLLAT